MGASPVHDLKISGALILRLDDGHEVELGTIEVPVTLKPTYTGIRGDDRGPLPDQR